MQIDDWRFACPTDKFNLTLKIEDPRFLSIVEEDLITLHNHFKGRFHKHRVITDFGLDLNETE